MDSEVKEIRISEILRLVWDNKMRFIKVGAVTFVLACAYILCIPRYYRSEVRLVPEAENAINASSLASIASTFGFDIGLGQSTDAISPEIYPDLFESNDFMVDLLGIGVRTEDGTVQTDYYTYLKEYQKSTPWGPTLRRVKNFFKFKKKQPVGMEGVGEDGKLNAFMLSENDNALVELARASIRCGIDKKTGIVSIQVEDQDRLIAATMADSVRMRLQDFITTYRTNKARVDVDYYQKLCAEAQQEYEISIERFGAYADTHSGSLRQSFQSRREALESDMQLKLTTLTALKQQLQSAQAKVQERTPAFTVLQNATVAVKPAGPKRMIFVALMLMLSAAGTFVWLMRRQLTARLGFETKDDKLTE